MGEQEARDAALVDENGLKASIEANQAHVERSLLYLSKNREELSEKTSVDPLSDLLHMGKQELAVAYDKLILALEDREVAIEARLRKSIEHYGLKERILLQGKDFAREMEDAPNVFETNIEGRTKQLNPEEIISVGQQVTNVLN